MKQALKEHSGNYTVIIKIIKEDFYTVLEDSYVKCFQSIVA